MLSNREPIVERIAGFQPLKLHTQPAFRYQIGRTIHCCERKKPHRYVESHEPRLLCDYPREDLGPADHGRHVDGRIFVPALKGDAGFGREPIYYHCTHYGNQGRADVKSGNF